MKPSAIKLRDSRMVSTQITKLLIFLLPNECCIDMLVGKQQLCNRPIYQQSWSKTGLRVSTVTLLGKEECYILTS